MTKDQMENLVIELDTQIDAMHKQIDFLQSLTDLDAIPGRAMASHWYPYEVVFLVRDMEQLHQTREYLRKQFGTWEDNLRMIWTSCNEANASWEGKSPSGMQISIRLCCDVPDFPQELQKNGCGFRKVTKTEMEFVCDGKE